MIGRLRRIGNHRALFLDKQILDLLGIEEEGHVQLTVQDGNLIVTPVRPSAMRSEVLKQKLNQILKEREGVLRRLAQ